MTILRLCFSIDVVFTTISIPNSLTKLLQVLILHQKPISKDFRARFGLILAQNLTMLIASGK